MNRLFLISGMAIFVAATILITNTPNTTMAYSCSSSSSAHNTNTPSHVSGSSGSCATSSSASTGSNFISSALARAQGPNQSINVNTFGIFDTTGAVQFGMGATSSSSAGGGQSSCSSSSGSVSSEFSFPPGATTISNSNSQPGRCP